MRGRIWKMNKRLKRIIPPPKWQTPVAILLGAGLGLALYLIKLAEVTSYLSDSPQACVNCHVMTPEYNSWMHSSHREWASCNDCHVPQNNLLTGYYFKAVDGLYHSYVFTTKQEPQVIKMREASQEVVQNNCIRCHIQQVTEARYDGWLEQHSENRTSRQCWSCHREIPHSRIHGLSTTEYTLAPLPFGQVENVIPSWLQQAMNDQKKKE